MRPPRTPSSLVAIVGATLAAAALAAAPLVSAGDAPRSSSTLARAEPSDWSAAHAHADTDSNRAADLRRLRRCARPEVRRADPVRCPRQDAEPEAGGAVRAAAVGDEEAASAGRWSAPVPIGTWAINATLLPTGKVLWLSKGATEESGGTAQLYDPRTGEVEQVPPPDVTYPDGSVAPANLFCAGHALLPDGRVLVAGGNLAYYRSSAPGESWKGSRWLFTFNPWNETWTRQDDMAAGRWYPTVTALPDGRALISGGWDQSGDDASNDDLEVFTPSPDLDGADGQVRVVGSRPWSQLYPHVFVLPDTTVAGAGAAPKLLLAGPAGRYAANAGILDTGTWRWTGIPPLPTTREFGAAVLMPGGIDGPDTVLLTGGSDSPDDPAPTSTSALLDLDDPAAGFRPGPALLTARTHVNAVLLPDGSVLAVGGGSGTSAPGSSGIYAGPVYGSEILDPGAAGFRAAAVQGDERTYHSTALLLPDGRVLSAGDDRASHAPQGERTAETYSPPYLFRGPRPRITFAPSAARYDAPIRVATPDPAAIDRAVLMRPSSVTHATDMDQRSVELAMVAERGGLTLRTPPNATVTPPGYHMLVLVDRDGVPSEAAWLRLDDDAGVAPEIPGGVSPAPAPPAAVPPPGLGDAPAPARLAPAPDGRATASRDRHPPRVAVRVLGARRAGRAVVVRIQVRADERARGRVVVALGRRTASRALRLVPRRGHRLVLRIARAPAARSVRVVVRVRDAAGNARTVRRSARVPPGRASPRGIVGG